MCWINVCTSFLHQFLLTSKRFRGYLDHFFSSLNFHHSTLITYHSSLITLHSKYHTCLALLLNFHHSIFFTLFVGPILVLVQLLFLFLFLFLFFLSTQITRTSERKKRKKKKPRSPETQEKKWTQKPSYTVNFKPWQASTLCVIASTNPEKNTELQTQWKTTNPEKRRKKQQT